LSFIRQRAQELSRVATLPEQRVELVDRRHREVMEEESNDRVL
jgi:hypothetical protein